MNHSRRAVFLERVVRTIERYGMLAPGDRVLVALSGGPDSVALAATLVALASAQDTAVLAAHLNHRLRGDESDRDQHCAETVATRLGIPIVVENITQPLGRVGLEASARDVRYAFLSRIAGQEGCNRIATGHTLDDQAETVLMRLVRGAGRDGLTGIPPVREATYIRPLIECSRAQVLAFVEDAGLEFCEDSSNSNLDFLRNRIRHEVLPLLRTINPRVSQRMASAGALLAEEAEYLEHQAKSLLTEVMSVDGTLSIAKLRGISPALQPRVLRAWLRSVRGDLSQLAATHIRAVVALAGQRRPNAWIPLPGHGRVLREYDRLRFTAQADPPSTEIAVLRPGVAVRLASGWEIAAEIITRTQPISLPANLSTLLADAAQMPATLTVRAPRRGDRIRPLGLDGHRKLQDVFVDRKLTRSIRRSCPVVEANGEVLWVPGVVRGAQALVTPDTRFLWRLTARQTGIAGA